MNRYFKYIAGAALLVVVLAAFACNNEESAAPAPGGAEPTAAMTATEPTMTATEPAMAATEPAEATAMPGGGGKAVAGNNRGSSRLDAVKARGKVICASRNDVAGYGYLDASGNNVGFDIDLCRALAAAVLGDPDAIESG